jgi:hypothetical protein
MSKEKPTERDGIEAYVGAEALRLKALYEKEAAKRGGSTAAREAIKAEALNLLAEIGAPSGMIRMFSVMMGRVKQEPKYSAEFKWLDFTLDYEAHARNEGRTVTHTEVANAIIDAEDGEGDLDHLIRRVSKMRNADWYPETLNHRCVYVMDNPETV